MYHSYCLQNLQLILPAYVIPMHRFRVKTNTTWSANSLQARQITDVPAKKVGFPMVMAGAREVRTAVFEHIEDLTLVAISY